MKLQTAKYLEYTRSKQYNVKDYMAIDQLLYLLKDLGAVERDTVYRSFSHVGWLDFVKRFSVDREQMFL